MTGGHKLQDIAGDRTPSERRTEREVEDSDRETKILRDREINKWPEDRQRGRVGARQTASERPDTERQREGGRERDRRGKTRERDRNMPM